MCELSVKEPTLKSSRAPSLLLSSCGFQSQICYQKQSNAATKGGNSALVKYKTSLEPQPEPVTEKHLTNNMKIHHSGATPGNWARSRGAALPSGIQRGNERGSSLGHQIGFQKQRSWKGSAMVALTALCTERCSLTDGIKAENGGGLKSCRSAGRAGMKGETVRQKAAHTHTNPTSKSCSRWNGKVKSEEQRQQDELLKGLVSNQHMIWFQSNF